MVNVKPVTLYDVAEYAGVSYQTVSRVVNRGQPRLCENAGKGGSGDGAAELHSQPRGTTTGGETVVADWRCYLQSGPARAVANCRGD